MSIETRSPLASLDSHEGASVSLERRKEILGILAVVYAQYARAAGLEKAAETSRCRELIRRYGSGVDSVVAGAKEKAQQQRLEAEATLIPELVQAEALIAAGFDPVDVETVGLETKIRIRQAIGVNVGARSRREVLKKVSHPQPSYRKT